MSPTASSLWLPRKPSAERAVTSATLDEGGVVARDRVVLYVRGERAAAFDVAAGLGAKLLTECGLEREP